MTAKKAKRKAVQAIRQIVQAAKDLAEAEQALLRDASAPGKRKPRSAERAGQKKEAAAT